MAAQKRTDEPLIVESPSLAATPKEQERQFRPFLAALICTLSTCFFTTMSLFTKITYVLYPSAGVYSLLFFRSMGTLFVVVPQTGLKHYREREKHSLIFSWLKINKFKWAIAIAHILIVSCLVQISLKTFPMSLVSIFLNCGPMLTVLLCALLMQSEKVTIGLVIKAVAAFAGVIMITLGVPE